MSIVIKDETAGQVVITIDNSGNMAFGDGTPVDSVTGGGYGVIDSNGYIIHGVGSCTMNGNFGSVNVGAQQQVFIYTIAGRTPTVQLDTIAPAGDYYISYPSQNDPNWATEGTQEESPLYGVTEHAAFNAVGGFTIVNQNEVDSNLLDPSGQYYENTLTTAVVAYRWV
jgi:hypothetical protein